MKYVYLFIMVLFISGCMSTDEVRVNDYRPGMEPDEMLATAMSQQTSTKIISKEAGLIAITSNNPKVTAAANVILEENNKVKLANVVFINESGIKHNILKKYEALVVSYNKLIEDYNSGFRKICMWLKIIGGVMIPIGIFLGFRLANEFFWLSVIGVLVIITTSVIMFIEKYYGWIIGAVVVSVLYVVVRPMILQSRATLAATQVGEALKQELKESNPSAVIKLFGSGTIPGTIQQDSITKKIITKTRKKVMMDAKPTLDKV